MDFESRKGQELRTWILFFVGIGLVIFFAIRETPINPWWTLIIGAFTSTALIVSAVRTAVKGTMQEVKETLHAVSDHDKEKLNVEKMERMDSLSNPSYLGVNGPSLVSWVYGGHPISIQPC